MKSSIERISRKINFSIPTPEREIIFQRPRAKGSASATLTSSLKEEAKVQHLVEARLQSRKLPPV